MEEPVRSTSVPEQEAVATREASLPQDAVREANLPQEDVVVREASLPQEDVVVREVSLPQEDVVVREVSLPQEDVVVREVSLPQEEVVVREVSSPQEEVSSPDVPSPITNMRAMIATFISEHLTANVEHPFATPCAKCQHQLARSPTKDESVPHCAWAGRLRVINFFQLNPTTGKTIPVCRQFAPKSSWADLIPAHPQKAIMPREWVKHQIQQIVTGQPKERTRYVFEFLTGRPMSSAETHHRWFMDQLKEQAHSLSDEQLWTLMVWALAESDRLSLWSTPKWKKQDNATFLLPADSKNTHFIQVSEIEFT